MPENDMVISGSDITFGLLEELFKQLKAGAKDPSKGLSGAHFRAFLEHRNPFERVERERVLPYADQQVESDYDYPEEFRICTPRQQMERLIEYFPNLNTQYIWDLTSGELPEGAEGWAVIPKPSMVAKNYYQALNVVLGLIANTRKFYNDISSLSFTQEVRQAKETIWSLNKLKSKTPGDYLVFPFQFGKRWRGHSVLNARTRFTESEFGLGSYELAILLLTHPNRFMDGKELQIDIAGCVYGIEWDCPDCLRFFWNNSRKEIVLDHNASYTATKVWGIPSGFMPQVAA